MKKYLHCIYSDSYSLIYSGRLWIAIIGIIFVNLLNVGNELVSNPLCNVYYLSVMRRSIGGFFIITICFSGVCYSDSHFSAVKNGYFYSEILRKGSNVYCSAKIMTALFFSFLASLLGNLIFILILKSYCIFMIKGEENIEYFLEKLKQKMKPVKLHLTSFILITIFSKIYTLILTRSGFRCINKVILKPI